jgi:hypothetical protein
MSFRFSSIVCILLMIKGLYFILLLLRVPARTEAVGGEVDEALSMEGAAFPFTNELSR